MEMESDERRNIFSVNWQWWKGGMGGSDGEEKEEEGMGLDLDLEDGWTDEYLFLYLQIIN
jgi:hypothetical protein